MTCFYTFSSWSLRNICWYFSSILEYS